MICYVLLEHIAQNDYTDSLYYSTAEDATYVLGVYSSRSAAEKELYRREKIASEDPDMIDIYWYEIQSFDLDEK